MKDAKTFNNVLRDMLGEGYTEENLRQLDVRLKEKIYKNRDSHKLYIHYSVQDPTYINHTQFMIEDFKINKLEVIEDMQEYEKHWELKYYFPEFLINTLKKELK